MTAVSRKALTAALRAVAPALPKATKLPALHGVHIDTGTGAVTCNNLDLAITTTVPILDRDTDAGAVLLPAKVLTRIVGSMSGETVHLSDPDERGDVTVKCGRTKATLPTIPTGDWFAPGDIKQGATFTLTAGDADRIRRVLHAASIDKARPGLCGIHLTGNLAQATDSYRLAQVELDGTDQLPGVIVPTEALRAALGDAESQLVMVSDGRRVALSSGDTTWTTTLIDYPGGSYPAFDRVLRDSSDINITVDVDELLEALKRLGSLGGMGGPSAPRLTSDGDTLTITRRMQDVGAITDQVDCTGDPLVDPICLDGDKLTDLLEQVRGDEVTLGIVDPLKPVLVAEDRFVGLVMPVRVS